MWSLWFLTFQDSNQDLVRTVWNVWTNPNIKLLLVITEASWNLTRFRFLGLNAVASPLSSSDADAPGKARSAKGRTNSADVHWRDKAEEAARKTRPKRLGEADSPAPDRLGFDEMMEKKMMWSKPYLLGTTHFSYQLQSSSLNMLAVCPDPNMESLEIHFPQPIESRKYQTAEAL